MIMFNTIWYDNLTKPFLNPPAWIFSPVWIILYVTLLVSLILYSIKFTQKNKFNGYIIFIIHMIFNILWSPVFFVLQKIGIALFIIVIIDITAILMVKTFFSVSKVAGLMLIPYLAWVLFATYLNIQFFRLN